MKKTRSIHLFSLEKFTMLLSYTDTRSLVIIYIYPDAKNNHEKRDESSFFSKLSSFLKKEIIIIMISTYASGSVSR